MRVELKPESPAERLALSLNLAPVPVIQSLWGMGVARVLMVAVRTGIVRAIADHGRQVEALAAELGLDLVGLQLVLDALTHAGYLRESDGFFSLTPRGQRWLDPAAPTSITNFLDYCHDLWEAWSRLGEVLHRGGRGLDIHSQPPDDPRWRRYILGQYELARLSAPEVAASLRIAPTAARVLDIGGGHGWFAAELCRRHPQLEATVLDLPGSVAIGREIIASAGLSDRVRHVEGDLSDAPLGGPYDLVLCFNIVHHLTPEQNLGLFGRIREALARGGRLAILDLFADRHRHNATLTSGAGLIFYLDSGSQTYASADVVDWLREAGFGEQVRRHSPRRLPVQTLLVATRD